MFEIHRLEKGERLWKHFEGEFEHCNGWAVVIPVAYYYLPDYEPNCSEWNPYSYSEIDVLHLIIIAYSGCDNAIEYLLIENDCVIGSLGKSLLENISEDSFLAIRTFPIY